jgi:hypothetical protein
MISDEEVLQEIQKELPILVSGVVTKQAILQQLELKISRLLHQNAEVFFQLLYRLDISEKKFQAALDDKQTAVSALAVLIYDRQLQKLASRKKNKPHDTSSDQDLTW